MLELKDVVREYNTGGFVNHALDHVSIKFRDSEFVAILGPSGSGKTTMLNIIGGLDHFTSGDLLINGVSTKGYNDKDWDAYRNHSVGFVFQAYNLIGHQTILSNVELALTISGVSAADRKQRAIDALEKVGLKDHMNKKPNQLSGGQMQRVAIARALVNDPEIVLADEPTGALDTETGIQIMELLKEVSKDRLVVMVTHNPELAEEYATRIVSISDGKIKSDTNPVGDDEKSNESGVCTNKVGMSLGTAFKLSMNNLRTKKGRTILTAVAGSIGIVGIALILSLSTAVNDYMDTLQKDTLSSYPLMIQSQTVDLSSITSSGFTSNPNAGKTDRDGIYGSVSGLSGFNIIKNDLSSFKKYIDNPDSTIHQYIGENGVSYEYDMTFTVLSKDSNGEYIDSASSPGDGSTTSGTLTMMSSLIGRSNTDKSTIFAEIPPDRERTGVNATMIDGYDVVDGKWPTEYNEAVLFLDETNSITLAQAYCLGLVTQDEYDDYAGKADVDTGDFQIISDYSEVIGKEYYMIPTCEFYKSSGNGTFYKESLTSFNQEDYLDKSIPFKIVGVVKSKGKNGGSTFDTPVGFTSKMTDHIYDIESRSEVVKAQMDNTEKSVITGTKFNVTTNEDKIEAAKSYLKALPDSEKVSTYTLVMASSQGQQAASQSAAAQQQMMPGMSYEDMMVAALDNWVDNESDDDTLLKVYKDYIGNTTYEDTLVKLGTINKDRPTSINIYTDSFEAKDDLINAINEYNETVPENERITFTDYVSVIANSVTSMVTVISAVLIAFVSISLVVSSIMIGIITHISVMERTKEIGILRALGASKSNISQVFNAETIIIGLFSGGIGIGIGYLLDIPATAIIQKLVDDTTVSAILNPVHALILVGISVLVTFIGGLLPAGKAAKKDPVEALRSE